MILLFLLACSNQEPDCGRFGGRPYDDPTCACRTVVYNLDRYNAVACRLDQDGAVSGDFLTCTCRTAAAL